jgi:hypothetical protein
MAPDTLNIAAGETVREIELISIRLNQPELDKIASRKPLRAVFRDSSFTSSPEKINVTEVFKLLAPNTTVKVI